MCKNGCSCPVPPSAEAPSQVTLPLSHQEVAFTSLSFESGFGHGACFGQLDLIECDMTKDLRITCEWGFPSPAVGDPSAAMNKPGLDSWRRDQMGRGPVTQLSQLSRHMSYVVSGHPAPAGAGSSNWPCGWAAADSTSVHSGGQSR